MLAYLSLGSNLGDRASWLRLGVEAVAAGEPYRVSPVYETEPVGGPPQDNYLNVVVELETTATPQELLERCRAAEAAAGRVRSVRFGPRTLDADVLLVGDLEVDTEELTVPHPRMLERRVVLQPLADLAPSLVDPAVLDASSGAVARVGTLDEFH
ncbi:MAG TPA: 2-amino-4-hydroxy-6-hydroxymethyldihydropteridine diphosphokinase [Acidimicrobiales bacterium]